MRLILLFADGIPILVPEDICIYDKSLGRYYTQNQELNSRLIVPNSQALDPIYRDYCRLYQGKFDKYCIVSSPSFDSELYFLYGTTRQKQKIVVIFIYPSCSLNKLGREGVLLDRSAIISCGTINPIPEQDVNEVSIEGHTINLFHMFKHCININCKQGIPRGYLFNFFNMQGDIFNYAYMNSILSEIKVNHITGDVSYIMQIN
ncbi:hypothetical protein DRF75_00695 [Ehrlichia minasensis]|uniref:Uncharacterized protein n=1 Tax=Ehrlichia minasensis TaxID=1242993 RepID=A0A4Q6I5L6_9RICK|nr:hypothetical protein [Ehrlichia minasensis]RZB13212.1 hypothetical protein DRF75_00695 [Ehrlichia minasensis]CEI85340.1 Uncharacterized protein ehr_00734 [Ehrlichia minasensis]